MEGTLRPLYDRIVVERTTEKEVSDGGIVIPDQARERSQIGKVIAIGHGRRSESGTMLPLGVKVGDFVVFNRYAGTDPEDRFFEHGGSDITIMHEEEVLAILER